MNKKQLVELVAQEMDKSKLEAETAVNVVIDCIKKGIQQDQVVQLIGFGSFNVRKRKARKGRNPKTGAAIKIKASKTVSFRAGKALKDSLS
jgi:DNA-binding protein HU-beta